MAHLAGAAQCNTATTASKAPLLADLFLTLQPPAAVEHARAGQRRPGHAGRALLAPRTQCQCPYCCRRLGAPQPRVSRQACTGAHTHQPCGCLQRQHASHVGCALPSAMSLGGTPCMCACIAPTTNRQHSSGAVEESSRARAAPAQDGASCQQLTRPQWWRRAGLARRRSCSRR